jgi:hypothetical protein
LDGGFGGAADASCEEKKSPCDPWLKARFIFDWILCVEEAAAEKLVFATQWQ